VAVGSRTFEKRKVKREKNDENPTSGGKLFGEAKETRKREWAGKVKFRLIKSQVRGSYAREKVNEHFSIVSGDCTLHDDSYGCFAVANASIDREIWTNKGDLARVTKYGNILMVLLGIATMNNLE